MDSVSLSFLGEAITQAVGEYGRELDEQVRKDVSAAARTARKEISEISARSLHKSGDYAGSWAVGDDSGSFGCKKVVYSKKPGLPHLLEKGHATRNGGRSRAYPHVAPGAAAGFAELERRMHG